MILHSSLHTASLTAERGQRLSTSAPCQLQLTLHSSAFSAVERALDSLRGSLDAADRAVVGMVPEARSGQLGSRWGTWRQVARAAESAGVSGAHLSKLLPLAAHAVMHISM